MYIVNKEEWQNVQCNSNNPGIEAAGEKDLFKEAPKLLMLVKIYHLELNFPDVSG